MYVCVFSLFHFMITNRQKNTDYILGIKPVFAICSRNVRICMLCAGGNCASWASSNWRRSKAAFSSRLGVRMGGAKGFNWGGKAGWTGGNGVAWGIGGGINEPGNIPAPDKIAAW